MSGPSSRCPAAIRIRWRRPHPVFCVRTETEDIFFTRNGQISSVFVFDEKQHCRSSYTAPLTSFLVDIDTERYLLEEDEHHLHLTIHYRLSVEGSSPTGCQTEIEIQLL